MGLNLPVNKLLTGNTGGFPDEKLIGTKKPLRDFPQGSYKLRNERFIQRLCQHVIHFCTRLRLLC